MIKHTLLTVAFATATTGMATEKWQKVVDERWAAGEAMYEYFRDVLGGVN